MLRALIVRRQWLDKILGGKKTWDIRGSRTAIRGTIGLIESASGSVVGLCEVVDCIGPLSANKFRMNAASAGMRLSEAKLGWYRNTYACYFLAFHYFFRVAGTFVGGSSSGSPCTLSDPSCSFDINRSSALGIVSTGPLARFRGLPLLSRITIGYSPLVFAFSWPSCPGGPWRP